MPIDQPQSESTYFIDAENAAEMARLTNQDRLLTQAMGGLFPPDIDLSRIHSVLDVGCGPGGWVLDVAHAYPKIKVTGIDISKLMVEYTRAQARVQWLDNATFKAMDALKPLEFPDNSFDLVNARFISSFTPKTAWPGVVGEFLRVLRPGGVIRLTEPEFPISNSPAVEKLIAMFARAMQKAGQSFSPDGRLMGITPMLSYFLRSANCQNTRVQAYVLDGSAGAEAYVSQYQNAMVFLKLLQPFIVRAGETTNEEFDKIYHQALFEMQIDSYCSAWYYLSAWGTKP